jgi:L-amino acid N-acyltransferase YncA
MTETDGYPRDVTVAGTDLRLEKMSAADRDDVVEFAGSLARHDMLFLRRDITRPDAVDAWLEDIAGGQVHTLLARRDGKIVGYATLHQSELDWSRHVGELRVLVSEGERGKGLGGFLTREIFALAIALDLEKIVARMTLDQQGAMKTFEGLGFRPEALMRDHVKDADGETHDLVVMCHSVADFQRTLEAYGVPANLGS